MQQLASAMQRVPTTRDVVRGARVKIVLKADQPTGRTVTGVVQDVLTRGNHPRGIKVRLQDGRIGRVQTMVAEQSPSSLGVDERPGGDETPASPTPHQVQGRQRASRGELVDQLPSSSVGLDAYVKPAKSRKRGNKARGTPADETPSAPTAEEAQSQETSTCPVCGAFEGDTVAVAHHVAGHFDD